ncbi:MAG: WG repeat-containing protein [Bacteroidia bacterium]
MKAQFKHFYFLLILIFSANASFAQKGKHKEKTGVAAKYEMVGPVCNGIMRVKLNHKWGFIDTTGNVVVPPKYNEVTNFSYGVARVRNGRKWGLIDTSGAILIKVECDFIGDFADGVAKVLIDGQTYYTDTKGQRVK